MSREEIRQLEKMIEIIVRTIPKESAAAKLYRRTAQQAGREMVRMLFAKLAKQAEEHESKLSATLAILRQELENLRQPGAAALPEDLAVPSKQFNVNIRRTLQLTTEMNALAEEGLNAANDPSCQALYQAMLEAAGKLRELAEDEIEKHIEKEKWD